MNSETDVFARCACCNSNEYEMAVEWWHYNGGSNSFSCNSYDFFPDLGEEHMTGETKVFVLSNSQDTEVREHICTHCFDKQFQSLKKKEKYTPENCCVVCLRPTTGKIRVMSVRSYTFTGIGISTSYSEDYVDTIECSPVAHSKKYGHTLKICNECTRDILVLSQQ